MHRAVVEPGWSFPAWRAQARAALAAGVPPDAIEWSEEASGLLIAAPWPPPRAEAALRVPRGFPAFATLLLEHRDPSRLALLYRVLWRITHGEAQLLERGTDADMHRARGMSQEIRRERHKMKAFLRFREIDDGEGLRYVAWFEPTHRVLDGLAPFFVRRFAGMRWSILTPERSAHWDGTDLTMAAGAQRGDAPPEDALEDVWRSYYANTFNPARPNPRMMQQEMPQKYWKHLPEAHLLPELLRDAGARVRAMAERAPEAPRRRIAAPAAPPAPADGSFAALRAAAMACRACPLWAPATQTVFGEGPEDARVMIVGEQPGDEEDLSGRPFIGPAGRLFDRALAELGLDRARFYVTNAVKHFKFERRGRHRLHRNPEPSERQACRIWLQRELAKVNPDIVVCLGATAAEAVFGKGFKLMEERGLWQRLPGGPRAFATVHPAWVLRQRDAGERETAYRNFRDDLARLRGA